MESFLGEIKIVSFNYAPPGWATCDGQELLIAQNNALYALLGTMYGGNGTTTFRLPDFRGRVPLHFGSGFLQGSAGGEAQHTLLPAEMPAHTHSVSASNAAANAPLPTGNTWASTAGGYAAEPDTTMNAGALSSTGGQPHENRQPYLVLNFIISLIGVFPPRS